MKWLIPPSTFSEGQRALYGCAVVLAGIFAGVVAVGMVVMFVAGVVLKIIPPALYPQIVTILGYALAGFICAMIAVIGFLALGGPVGRFKANASLKDGVGLEATDHESAASITTTTTMTASPPAGPKLP